MTGTYNLLQMSLITRCPACGTMFRVVPDQLKISQGWVRCGQCTDVFDATAHMQAEAAGPTVRSEADARHAGPVPLPAVDGDPEDEGTTTGYHDSTCTSSPQRQELE